MRTHTTWLVAGAIAAVALYWTLSPGEPAAPPAAKEDPDLFAFVRSMEGTRPDGSLTVAAGDTLVVDAELGHLFDYYLAGLGEKPLEAIRSQIELELDRRLAPPPAREAKRLLAAYLSYKQALVLAEQARRPMAAAHGCRRCARCAPRILRRRKAQACSARSTPAMTTRWRAWRCSVIPRWEKRSGSGGWPRSTPR